MDNLSTHVEEILDLQPNEKDKEAGIIIIVGDRVGYEIRANMSKESIIELMEIILIARKARK